MSSNSNNSELHQIGDQMHKDKISNKELFYLTDFCHRMLFSPTSVFVELDKRENQNGDTFDEFLPKEMFDFQSVNEIGFRILPKKTKEILQETFKVYFSKGMPVTFKKDFDFILRKHTSPKERESVKNQVKDFLRGRCL